MTPEYRAALAAHLAAEELRRLASGVAAWRPRSWLEAARAAVLAHPPAVEVALEHVRAARAAGLDSDTADAAERAIRATLGPRPADVDA